MADTSRPLRIHAGRLRLGVGGAVGV